MRITPEPKQATASKGKILCQLNKRTGKFNAFENATSLHGKGDSFTRMILQILRDKPTRLFVALASFFVANALIAECIGTKLFSLPRIFGMEPETFTLFGQEGLSYILTCGVLLWPLEFVMTDVVNEFYGPKAVRRISFIAIALILYAFFMFYLAIRIPADRTFWITSQTAEGIPDMQAAFASIFGQGMWIIFGSLVAFLVSQLVDVFVFHRIKKATGEKRVWLRATGSTLVSQLVDSFIVLGIAFGIGKGWSWQRVLAIGMINYSYKATMALVLTPVIYLIENRIAAYFGPELTQKMKLAAMGREAE